MIFKGLSMKQITQLFFEGECPTLNMRGIIMCVARRWGEVSLET